MGSTRQRGPSPLPGPPLSWPAPGAGGSSWGIRTRPQGWWGSGLLWELRWKTGAGATPGVGGDDAQRGACWGRGLVGGPPTSRFLESQQPQRQASGRSSASRSSTAHSAVNRLKRRCLRGQGASRPGQGSRVHTCLGPGPFLPPSWSSRNAPPHPSLACPPLYPGGGDRLVCRREQCCPRTSPTPDSG